MPAAKNAAKKKNEGKEGEDGKNVGMVIGVFAIASSPLLTPSSPTSSEGGAHHVM